MSESATCTYQIGETIIGTIPPKPIPLKVIAENIPDELKRFPQWVVWKYKWDGAKWTKPPCQSNGRYASSTNPDTWRAFDTALDACKKRGFDGLGIALTENMGIIGIDLDNISEEDKSFFLGAMKGSYAELSPSGKGLRIFAKGTLPVDGTSWKNEEKGYEIYKAKHYLTITGHTLDNNNSIITNQPGIDIIYNFITNHQSTGPTIPQRGGGGEEDPGVDVSNDVNDRFSALLKSDPIFEERFQTPAKVGDRSDHEFYLCCYILEHGFNAAEVRAIMDTSPQTKWNSRNNKFKDNTIKRASQKVKRAEHQKDFIIKYDDVIIEDDKGNGKFSPTKASEAVIKAFNVIAATSDNGKAFYWVYDKQKGIYDKGEDRICRALNSAAGDKFTINAKNETLTKITYLTGTKIEEFDKDPYLLCLKNGVVDLRTGEFGNHSPKHCADPLWSSSRNFHC
jgi:putative DNA primase/helicase